MTPIISTRQISFKALQSRMEYALGTRIGHIATIVLDTLIVVVPLLFFAVQVVFHLINTGFNPVNETISMYVWCDYGIAQSIVFFLQSVAMFALTARLCFILKRTTRSKWGIGILGLIGIGMLIVSICPTREYGAPVTGLVIAHVGAALVIAGLFPLALFLIAPGFKMTEYWNLLCGFTIAIAAIATVIGLAGLAIILSDIPGLGIIERIMMLNSILWMLVMGIKLLYQSSSNFILYEKPHLQA